MKGAIRSGSNKAIGEQFLIAMTEPLLQQGGQTKKCEAFALSGGFLLSLTVNSDESPSKNDVSTPFFVPPCDLRGENFKRCFVYSISFAKQTHRTQSVYRIYAVNISSTSCISHLRSKYFNRA